MIRPHAILALAVSLLCLPAAAAEDPFQLGLALRAGCSLDAQDKLNPLLMGLGLTVEVPMAGALTLKGELAYLYKPGRQYLAGLQPAFAGQPQADPAQSADLRKNQLDALVLRLGAAWALDPATTQKIAPAAAVLARAEGLDGHAHAAQVRL